MYVFNTVTKSIGRYRFLYIVDEIYRYNNIIMRIRELWIPYNIILICSVHLMKYLGSMGTGLFRVKVPRSPLTLGKTLN